MVNVRYEVCATCKGEFYPNYCVYRKYDGFWYVEPTPSTFVGKIYCERCACVVASNRNRAIIKARKGQ